MKVSKVVPNELTQLLMTCSKDFDTTSLLVCADWCQENNYNSLERLLRYIANRQSIGCFQELLLTGSRAYSIPNDRSDFDWVFNSHEYVINELIPLSDSYHKIEGVTDEVPLNFTFRFTPVNLLCVHWGHQFEVWKNVTEELIKKKPVTRNEAVEAFKREFANNLLTSNEEFSGDSTEIDEPDYISQE